MRLRPHLSWLALLALAPLGCMNGGPATVPVSGRVTVGDAPLRNADVTFTPAGNVEPGKPPVGASGRTDDQGRYSLKLDGSGRDGAAPGAYRVRISVFDRGGDGRPARGQLVPREYNRDTTLTYTVGPGGSIAADFHLPGAPLLIAATAPPR